MNTQVLFTDLVKAYYSMQHEMIHKALQILSVSNNLIKQIMKLCNNFLIILNVGNEELHIPYSCRFKQCDSLLPFLLCLVFQIVVKSIQVEFIRNLLTLVIFRKLSKYIRFNTKILISTLLFIDDGALPFSSRDNLINGLIIYINAIAKFGLTIYAERVRRNSKTEAKQIEIYLE